MRLFIPGRRQGAASRIIAISAFSQCSAAMLLSKAEVAQALLRLVDAQIGPVSVVRRGRRILRRRGATSQRPGRRAPARARYR
ncbi:hypothetical protein MPC4_20005 [Methylocella tundrae]|uniref:Uncharacterized protein n=1 Tax=Methylocella tundrae TaxID=227605 RepID=A0A8B6M4Q1_METTU|nr:hypothetical protein MPC1_11040002 [Methylocella tundrae]VTZ49795.1 hypothetical protein MPC4_20005 [Methylocella tundrae]